MSEALELVERMVEALNNHVIEGQEEFWSEDMVWHGPAGIGTKHGLRDFQDNHQRPFLHAFPDKLADDQIRFGAGEWVAATGIQRATHKGDWLGITASGAQVEVRLTNFGSLFIGQHATVAYGDKAIGTNHTLPTMKAARYTGGLWVGKFLKTVTTQRCSAEGDRLVAEHAAVVADAEFMYGHAVSSRLRLDPEYFEEALSWSE